MNKKIIMISLVILVALAVVLGVILLNQNQNQNNTNVPKNNVQQEATSQNPQNIQNTQNQQNSETVLLPLIMPEIAKHNSKNDCWVIVENKVYNVSNYIDLHPGGSDKIIPFCGKDATNAFNTKGGKGSHSPKAGDILKSYYVGDFMN